MEEAEQMGRGQGRKQMEQEAQRTKTGRQERDGVGQRTKEAAALGACRYVLIHQRHWPPLCLLQHSSRPQRSPQFLCNCGPTLRSAEAQGEHTFHLTAHPEHRQCERACMHVCVCTFAVMPLLLASLLSLFLLAATTTQFHYKVGSTGLVTDCSSVSTLSSLKLGL